LLTVYDHNVRRNKSLNALIRLKSDNVLLELIGNPSQEYLDRLIEIRHINHDVEFVPFILSLNKPVDSVSLTDSLISKLIPYDVKASGDPTVEEITTFKIIANQLANKTARILGLYRYR
jgi:hypothetical protein